MRTYWSYYLPVVFLLFAVPEGVAIARGRTDDTLSGYIWRMFDVIRSQPISQWSFQHFAFACMFTSLVVWLLGHFLFHVWT